MNEDTYRSIFAVVGLAGTGKSSVVQILQDVLQAPVVYFGGVVVAEVCRRGLPVTEANERDVREELRSRYGMSAVALLAGPNIEASLALNPEIVIDGLYSYAEYQLLQERYPDQLCLIAVHSTRALREERMAQRSTRPLSPEEIRSRDLREIRTLDKATAIALADWHVVNDSTFDDLTPQVTRVITGIRDLRAARTPS